MVILIIHFIYHLIISADREVQRILLELLNQMDGFDQTINVKVMFKLRFLFNTQAKNAF